MSANRDTEKLENPFAGNNGSGGSGGSGSGGGGSGGRSDGFGGPYYNGATEIVSGRYSDGVSSHTVTFEFTAGNGGSIHRTFIDGQKDAVGQSSYHPDGNVHYHGTHWHGANGKEHGFLFPKKRR